MHDHPILRTATFDPRVKTYFMLNTIIICIVTVVGIVILPIVLVVGFTLIQAYLDRMACVLTERTLELKKGILRRTESTVPLEKITDLQMFQGPIMRAFGLHGFKVETAGQTNAGVGSLLSIIGIVDAPAFRKAVLAQRDLVSGVAPSARAATVQPPSATDELRDIRDAVLRIERLLEVRHESRG